MTSQPSTGGGHAARGGRRRDPAADDAILESVLALLGEGCAFGALSMDLVAQRAGVARATVYRRWANKEELVLAALGRLDPPLPALEGLALRDRLVRLVDQIRHRGEDTDLHRLLAGLLGEAARRPRLVRQFEDSVIAARREALKRALADGVDSGELRSDLDLDTAVELLTGPMLSRLILRQRPVRSPSFAEEIVETFLYGNADRRT